MTIETKPITTATCSGCVFFATHLQEMENGENISECRRNPPTVLPDERRATFPMVGESDWCGEHKPSGSGHPAPSDKPARQCKTPAPALRIGGVAYGPARQRKTVQAYQLDPASGGYVPNVPKSGR